MHRAWLIGDVLTLIMEELPPEALAAVSRTARFLHKPAARILWKDVNANIVLDYIIQKPNSLRQSKEGFEYYAPLIRRLEMGVDWDPLILSELTTIGHSPESFTNLQELSFIIKPVNNMKYIVSFLVPSLTCLKMHVTPNLLTLGGHEFLSLLAEAQRRSPSLVDIEFDGPTFTISPLPTECDGALESWIRSYPKLLSFSLRTCSLGLMPLVISALLTCRPLQKLALFYLPKHGFLEVDEKDAETICSNAGVFQTLKDFTLLTTAISTAFAMFNKLPSTLETADISLRIPSRQPSAHLYDIGYRLPRLTGLRSVSIKLSWPYSRSISGPTFYWSYLRGLEANRNLVRLQLQVRFAPFHIEDDELESLAIAWPYLESLEIDWLRPTDLEDMSTQGAPTLVGLTHLARRCRKLRSLRLSCVVTPPSFPDLSSLPSNDARLEMKAFFPGNIHAETLGVFLDALWPRVKMAFLLPDAVVKSIMRCKKARNDRLIPPLDNATSLINELLG